MQPWQMSLTRRHILCQEVMVSRRADLTFIYNRAQGRHGWVRLTPAYSVKMVENLLDANPSISYVLDPFAGTGTTGLVCGSRGLNCDLFDINPFLIWLGKVKTGNYPSQLLDQVRRAAARIVEEARHVSETSLWIPPISNIERWWTQHRLNVLAKLFHALSRQLPEDSPAKDLLLVAFCRLIIQWSNAAFNHQSMSFKDEGTLLLRFDEEDEIYQSYLAAVQAVISTARQPISGRVEAQFHDSRYIHAPDDRLYDCVITSPPYPNRMSYIRELRPYMYWLGYLKDGREAGELDWEAIGGTWGIATSRLQAWEGQEPSIPELRQIIAEIADHSTILANYVHRYFADISQHLESLYRSVSPGARLYYIVGNSKFYDTLVPVETLYASIMQQCGYTEARVEPIRKRSSKRELFEFIVSAKKPV